MVPRAAAAGQRHLQRLPAVELRLQRRLQVLERRLQVLERRLQVLERDLEALLAPRLL